MEWLICKFNARMSLNESCSLSLSALFIVLVTFYYNFISLQHTLYHAFVFHLLFSLFLR